MTQNDPKEWMQQYDMIKNSILTKVKLGEPFSVIERKKNEIYIDTLETQLKTFLSQSINFDIAPSEVARRQSLIESLRKILIATNRLSTKTTSIRTSESINVPESTEFSSSSDEHKDKKLIQKEIIQMQDSMLQDIEQGVTRLVKQARVIKEETISQNETLSRIDNQADVALLGVHKGVDQMENLQIGAKTCWLYIVVAVELIVLVPLFISLFI